MRTKTVEITEGATGKKHKAELLVCPLCRGEKFVIYIPEGIGHTHFQCVDCGTSFCDGCTPEGGAAPQAKTQAKIKTRLDEIKDIMDRWRNSDGFASLNEAEAFDDVYELAVEFMQGRSVNDFE